MRDNTNLVPDDSLSTTPGTPEGKHLARRHFVASASALVAGVGVAGTFGLSEHTSANSRAIPNTLPEDTILDQLYKAELAEDGELVVYGGGDAAHFYDAALDTIAWLEHTHISV